MRSNNSDSSEGHGFKPNRIDYGVGITAVGTMLILTVLLLYFRFWRSDPDQQDPAETPRVELSPRERGVEESVILSYPTIMFSEKHEAFAQLQDRSCSICLEGYKHNEQLRMVMDCRHVYHVRCIDEWLTRHPSCPICRNPPRGS
ncbi:hypothetical protein SUGI_1027390 [Cryptomeria japonica]|nr:hypothetical protein SUGI_1027390 [Cryptomeria japonica]